MATTTYNPNKNWLGKWLKFEPHVIIGGDDDPYLLRWLVIPRNPYFNIYLHKFLRSDDDRALHDHPWDWWSFIIMGAYYEHFEAGKRFRPRFSLAHRRAEEAHRVELLRVFPEPSDPEHWSHKAWVRAEKPTWTLFITTKKRREWGFLCGGKIGWRHWEKFTQGAGPGGGRGSLGCGEE